MSEELISSDSEEGGTMDFRSGVLWAGIDVFLAPLSWGAELWGFSSNAVDAIEGLPRGAVALGLVTMAPFAGGLVGAERVLFTDRLGAVEVTVEF